MVAAGAGQILAKEASSDRGTRVFQLLASYRSAATKSTVNTWKTTKPSEKVVRCPTTG
jgi:hypothetical protein